MDGGREVCAWLGIVSFLLFVFPFNKPDPWVSSPLLHLPDLTEVARPMVIGSRKLLQDAILWREMLFPRPGESSSKTPCTCCLCPFQAFYGGFLQSRLPCRGDQVRVVHKKGPKEWVLSVATESLMGIPSDAESRVVLKWPARWLEDSPWPSSPTQP